MVALGQVVLAEFAEHVPQVALPYGPESRSGRISPKSRGFSLESGRRFHFFLASDSEPPSLLELPLASPEPSLPASTTQATGCAMGSTTSTHCSTRSLRERLNRSTSLLRRIRWTSAGRCCPRYYCRPLRIHPPPRHPDPPASTRLRPSPTFAELAAGCLNFFPLGLSDASDLQIMLFRSAPPANSAKVGLGEQFAFWNVSNDPTEP
jgi:hypothetical protein